MRALTAVIGVAALSLQVLSAQSASQTFKGHLVDVMCAEHHASEGSAYGEKHDRACLLMESCVKSGYPLLTADGKVLKFDAKGSAMALDVIKKTEREKDWRVTVTGIVSDGVIAASSLALQ